MLRSIAAQFNSICGSNITYVANAFSTSEDQWIWICFHRDRFSSQNILEAINTKRDASIGSRWKNVTDYELMRVPYRQVHRQERSEAWERLTVISNDATLLTCNFLIQANRSFIVTRVGGIKAQMYGGNLWEDESRKNHYPQPGTAQTQLQGVRVQF